MTLLLLADPGGIGTLLRDAPVRPVLLLGLLVALTFLGAQFGAAIGSPGHAKPVPVRVRAGIRRLPR